MAVTAAFSSLSRSYVTSERLMFAATIAADLETKFGESIGTGESQVMFWGADIRRAAYDPETVFSMLSNVPTEPSQPCRVFPLSIAAPVGTGLPRPPLHTAGVQRTIHFLRA